MRRMGLGAVVVVGWVLVGCKSPVGPPPKPDAGSPNVKTDAGAPEESWRTPAGNPIPAENALPGDRNWMQGRNTVDGEVWVYTSTDSLAAGESFSVKVSTSIPSSVTAQVFRMGDYGGAGARQVWSGGPYSTQKQPDCPMAPATGLIECAWADTFSVTVGSDWVSGLYAVRVIRSDGFRRFHPFVVRDTRVAEIVYSLAFNTDQAYNTFGGESLYADASGTMPNHKAYEVSYDRPYAAANGLAKVFYLQRPLVQILERNGYNVTYVTNLDFVRFSRLVAGVPMIVHGTHDEYWAVEQRNQLDAALASGKSSLAFFGANGGYWRTRVRSSSDGRPYRILVCYKNMAHLDPEPNSTIRYRDPPNAHPENALFGIMYEGWTLNGFPLVVKEPGHWLFEKTGLRRGDRLPGLIGFEYDRTFDNGFTPEGLEIAAESPALSAEGVPGRAHTVSHELSGGHSVFSAGTIWWALGLGNPELSDPRVQQMTLNVFEHGLAPLRSKRTDLKIVGSIPTPPPPIGHWASAVDDFVGAPGEGGLADGPGATAQFNGPTGLAVNAAGEIAVADTKNQRIRVIGADSARTVRTIAGSGVFGWRDGAGAQAWFRNPTSLAYGPDGALYVADSDAHVIRRIADDPPAYTVTTIAGKPNMPGYADGAARQAQFNRPTALVVDAQGAIFLTDQASNRIRMISADHQSVTTVAGSGDVGLADNPNPLAALFNNPSALALGPGGEIYVVDGGNGAVRRISAGSREVTTIAADLMNDPHGYADGSGARARFRAQSGMVMDGAAILIADTGNHRIRKIVPGPNAQSTSVSTIAGSGNVGLGTGPGDVADITLPAGLADLGGGRFAVTDPYHNVVRIITP